MSISFTLYGNRSGKFLLPPIIAATFNKNVVNKSLLITWTSRINIRSNHQLTVSAACIQSKMAATTSQQQNFKVQDLESVNRITHLPIVESGWNIAESVYNKIKNSNTLFHWTLIQAESTLQIAVDTALPTLALFQTPISSIDKVLCKSLDIVEEKIPSIGLPPEMIYWNTKQYVADVGAKIARPVLKRADSVKQIGNTVLSSKYTTYAADTLDGALNVADKYVDKYLPDDEQQNEQDINNKEDNSIRAIQTYHHMGRFSGKLQRRLTKRTLAEAKALKEQSTEAIHVLIYVAELVVTDPKLAYTKGKELWEELSKDEPENQARPETVEQLIVLLTRESTRRVVHFINYTGGVVSKVQKNVGNKAAIAVSNLVQAADALVKNTHLEGVQQAVVSSLKNQAQNFTVVLKQVNTYISDVLDNIAESLATASEETQKTALEVPKIKVQLRAVLMKNSNGVDSNAN